MVMMAMSARLIFDSHLAMGRNRVSVSVRVRVRARAKVWVS